MSSFSLNSPIFIPVFQDKLAFVPRAGSPYWSHRQALHTWLWQTPRWLPQTRRLYGNSTGRSADIWCFGKLWITMGLGCDSNVSWFVTFHLRWWFPTWKKYASSLAVYVMFGSFVSRPLAWSCARAVAGPCSMYVVLMHHWFVTWQSFESLAGQCQGVQRWHHWRHVFCHACCPWEPKWREETPNGMGSQFINYNMPVEWGRPKWLLLAASSPFLI